MFLVPILILITPWRIRFADRTWGQVYYGLLLIGLGVPFIYGTRRLCIALGWPKLLIPFTLVSGIGLTMLVVFTYFFIPPPYAQRYMLLYTHPEHENETIEIEHNYILGRSWNEPKRVKNFPTLGISFRKGFEQKDLNGNWIVNEGNPYCDSIGQFGFKNGVIETKE